MATASVEAMMDPKSAASYHSQPLGLSQKTYSMMGMSSAHVEATTRNASVTTFSATCGKQATRFGARNVGLHERHTASRISYKQVGATARNASVTTFCATCGVSHNIFS